MVGKCLSPSGDYCLSELLHIQCCCDKQIAEEEMWGCEHPTLGSEGLSVNIGSQA